METYTVIALSTSHIKDEDRYWLSYLADKKEMIFERDTGYFIKFYEELELNDYIWEIRPHLRTLITWCHNKGFRMLELDRDAPTQKTLTNFKW